MRVALSVTVLTRSVQVNHEELAAHVVPGNEALAHGEYADVWDLYELQGLAAIDGEITTSGLYDRVHKRVLGLDGLGAAGHPAGAVYAPCPLEAE